MIFSSLLSRITLLFAFIIVLLLCSAFGTNGVSKSRVRRRVVFTKSSKYFFRFNGKLSTLNYTTIVAFGYTVRVNWDLPHDTKNRFLFFKRDIHNDIENIPDELAQGFSCALNHVCQVVSSFRKLESCGFFCEIGKIIARETGLEGNFFKSLMSRCDYYETLCPHNSPPITTVSYG
ncbi:hypothetical protein JTB14_009166 [Gonioctena quinquepunctata]|nr:hypothetical protein JTB14_009166 [Gonioctena quinquepunctata]